MPDRKPDCPYTGVYILAIITGTVLFWFTRILFNA
jgi:hypothetical protein